MSRKAIVSEALEMTAERIAAVLTGLQMLAGMCDGAHSIDGHGFNKMDTTIGKSLAQNDSLTPRQAALGAKLVNKYRRQLTADIVTAASGK